MTTIFFSLNQIIYIMASISQLQHKTAFIILDAPTASRSSPFLSQTQTCRKSLFHFTHAATPKNNSMTTMQLNQNYEGKGLLCRHTRKVTVGRLYFRWRLNKDYINGFLLEHCEMFQKFQMFSSLGMIRVRQSMSTKKKNLLSVPRIFVASRLDGRKSNHVQVISSIES